MCKNHSSQNGMRMHGAGVLDTRTYLWSTIRFEQPEVGSETVSVSLSCPEFSVKDRNKRVERDKKES